MAGVKAVKAGNAARNAAKSGGKGFKNLTERLGNRDLNKKVQAVNKGKLDRSDLTPEQRKISADFFREAAENTGGKFKDATAQFNRHRADFIEG